MSHLLQLAKFRSIKPFTRTLATLNYSNSLFNVPQTKVSLLKNGLTVATHHCPTETATVGLWIKAGSRLENEKNNGTAHFLEHMAFKVLSVFITLLALFLPRLTLLIKKGSPQRTQHQLELQIENMGGHLNAYTSRDQTVYFAKVFNSDIPQAVNILSDIVQNSTLSPENIERERLVILREQEEVEKQMEEVIFDHLHATAFQATSLGRTILGPKENIKSLQRSDLVDFIKNHYTADRMVLSAAGGIQHDALVKLAEKFLSSLPTSVPGASEPFEHAEFTGSEVRIRDDDLPNAHIAIAVEGVSWTSPDYFPLLIAQSIIGSYDRTLSNSSHLSSSLATRIHQNSLASSYTAFNTCYNDTGLFGIYATAPAGACGKLADLMYLIQNEWMRLCFDIKDVEFARAKQGLKSMMLFGLDGTTAICEDIGRQMLTLGRHMTPYEVDKAIDAVSKDQVMAVAKEYIYDKDIAVASIGPVETLPDYLVLRNHMDWNRV